MLEQRKLLKEDIEDKLSSSRACYATSLNYLVSFDGITILMIDQCLICLYKVTPYSSVIWNDMTKYLMKVFM